MITAGRTITALPRLAAACAQLGRRCRPLIGIGQARLHPRLLQLEGRQRQIVVACERLLDQGIEPGITKGVPPFLLLQRGRSRHRLLPLGRQAGAGALIVAAQRTATGQQQGHHQGKRKSIHEPVPRQDPAAPRCAPEDNQRGCRSATSRSPPPRWIARRRAC